MRRKCSPAAPSVSGQMRAPSVCCAFISVFVALHVKKKRSRLVISASAIRQKAAAADPGEERKGEPRRGRAECSRKPTVSAIL